MTEPLWRPHESAFTESNLARFALANGFDPHDYAALHEWSITERGDFWSALWDFAGVIGERGTVAEVLPPAPAHMFGTRYFPEARLNFTENLLRGDDDRRAVVVADESGVALTLTLGELKQRVAGAQQGLRRLGIGLGDIVAGILPNGIDNLVAYLATVSLGAAWAGCSPDFGAAGLRDRIGQVSPSVLIVADGYDYNGTTFDITGRVADVVAALPKTPTVIVAGAASWDEHFVDESAVLEYERFPFATPLLVMFTSGTTGLPKCIVHTAGGVLLQHLKEHVLHGDVRPGDVHSWYTSTAWMMYGWVVSVLAAEATVLLIDGSPSPGGDSEHLWRMAEEAGVTHFGTSPRYLASIADAGYRPRDHFALESLRSVLSAGAPVSVEQYHWVYDAIKPDMVFASISGGTDIHGCFMLGSPVHPVYAGEITCIALGHAVTAMTEANVPVIGEKADLVITEPFPSMPLTFLGDDGEARYRTAYFAVRDDLWTHGDLVEVTERGTVIVYGRSDATLNPSGVRIGTAELYRVLDQRPEIADSIAFGYVDDGNEEVAVCVVLADGVDLTDELARDLRRDLRDTASPRHVPKYLKAVSQIPYTTNGKKVETAAKAAAAGTAVPNVGSLSNPEALDEIAALFA
ncbi:acetoacetyl-CoA synthetase [Conyzicola lurida]|uniref:Acetoacetyl-CoA synthetase n=1 Tax=Conyzicola lurida TaxID=1172621 RepID=A0A841ALB6_9MICO|nr:acetoacetate--CoA ligase [Conyzicola lurida]MBB5842423.1 acetoacetyl-CoA synthetase [Conyzicola lurida]